MNTLLCQLFAALCSWFPGSRARARNDIVFGFPDTLEGRDLLRDRHRPEPVLGPRESADPWAGVRRWMTPLMTRAIDEMRVMPRATFGRRSELRRRGYLEGVTGRRGAIGMAR